MNRRTFLGGLAATGAVLLAGCSSSGGEGSPTDEQTPAEPSQSPVLEDTEFAVDDRTSGGERDEATVRFEAPRVVVEGVIWGRDGCKTATLLGSEYDRESNTLTVSVGTTDREGTEDQACTQAIVEIEYTATATFDAGLPSRVVVEHDHGDGPEQVADSEL
ncbi:MULTISPECIES: twin-arginine translocation signal domain-containing protein [Haloarcula]|uniref:twin-arginine translocation signal domain-containing protein n=1 Tax=Haloarcula TaxID=2237 RepID=UPI0023EC2B26|nr:twin-arginine translocation signal domain-containing protein [Halomicroarcula sp. XH51]